MTSSTPVFHSINEIQLPFEGPIALTMGTFDGVHRAHQQLIKSTIHRAREVDGKAVVLTFQNHPRSIISPDQTPKLLTPWEEKSQYLRDLGIDALVGLEFTRELMAMEAEDFLRNVIVGRLKAKFLSCGPAFHFGHDGRGNADLLQRLSPTLGYQFHPHEPIMAGSLKVSSTRIRAALASGNVAEAGQLLGRPHRNRGVVVTGDQLGRTIGWPTANLLMQPEYQLPADGVYAVSVTRADGTVYTGMMNLGTRPTVGGLDHRKEVHLIGFDGDLVGEELIIDYHERLRGEKKFHGLEELKEQLSKDKEAAISLRLDNSGH